MASQLPIGERDVVVVNVDRQARRAGRDIRDRKAPCQSLASAALQLFLQLVHQLQDLPFLDIWILNLEELNGTKIVSTFSILRRLKSFD